MIAYWWYELENNIDTILLLIHRRCLDHESQSADQIAAPRLEPIVAFCISRNPENRFGIPVFADNRCKLFCPLHKGYFWVSSNALHCMNIFIMVLNSALPKSICTTSTNMHSSTASLCLTFYSIRCTHPHAPVLCKAKSRQSWPAYSIWCTHPHVLLVC